MGSQSGRIWLHRTSSSSIVAELYERAGCSTATCSLWVCAPCDELEGAAGACLVVIYFVGRWSTRMKLLGVTRRTYCACKACEMRAGKTAWKQWLSNDLKRNICNSSNLMARNSVLKTRLRNNRRERVINFNGQEVYWRTWYQLNCPPMDQ